MVNSLLITKVLPSQSKATPPILEIIPENVLLVIPIWAVLKPRLASRPNRVCKSSQN